MSTTMHLLVDIVVERRHNLTVSHEFYWPRQYQFVRDHVSACEVCQRVESVATLAHSGRMLQIILNQLFLWILRRPKQEYRYYCVR